MIRIIYVGNVVTMNHSSAYPTTYSLCSVSGGGSRYRTVSGASVESVPHTTTRPAVSLSSLTGHVQQLRAYLPNSTVIRGATQVSSGAKNTPCSGDSTSCVSSSLTYGQFQPHT